MSTWVFHLRVAEKVQSALQQKVIEQPYYVGSIAPDSGRMVGNFTYLPSKDVSHWKREGVSYEQRFLDNGEFFKKYGLNEQDRFKKSLYLGYFVHILTDTIYVRDIIHPYIHQNGKPFWQQNIEAIRTGWYQIDHRFLAEHKGFHPFQVICQVGDFPNTYFDYFTPDDITERVHFAADLFTNGKADYSLPLLTHDAKKADQMADYMTTEILEQLKKYGVK